jgi:hypothetical protein
MRLVRGNVPSSHEHAGRRDVPAKTLLRVRAARAAFWRASSRLLTMPTGVDRSKIAFILSSASSPD